jgi:outer membrane protein W
VKSRFVISIVFFSLFAGHAIAADNVYGVFSLGYSDAEFAMSEGKNTAYKLGVGYQFDRQWYAEFGFQQLADERLQRKLPETLEGAQNYQNGMQGVGLYAAVLGKAANQVGELYYRLGVLKTDLEGQSMLTGSASCELGVATEFNVASGDSFTLCDYDEGGVAGVIGIGFDYYLGTKTMLRTEVEYIQGENDLQVSAGYIGIRYNF